jgi:hypothetical protein
MLELWFEMVYERIGKLNELDVCARIVAAFDPHQDCTRPQNLYFGYPDAC